MDVLGMSSGNFKLKRGECWVGVEGGVSQFLA